MYRRCELLDDAFIKLWTFLGKNFAAEFKTSEYRRHPHFSDWVCGFGLLGWVGGFGLEGGLGSVGGF